MKQDDQVVLAVVAVLGMGAWLLLRPREARATPELDVWTSLPDGAQQLTSAAHAPSAEGPGWLETAGTWWSGLWTEEPGAVAYRTPAQWRTLLTPEFRQWENEFGLPQGLLEAIAERESGFRHDIITCKSLGGVGEKGLMQIWPKYHPDRGCTPLWSIEYAAGWFRRTFTRYRNWELVIMAWNWGSGNMDEFGIANAPPLTRDYIAQIGRQVDLA